MLFEQTVQSLMVGNGILYSTIISSVLIVLYIFTNFLFA